ncbi:ATP-binding protein [Nonomuraea sp. B12E4]|uniref:ATP-binding protein n=1 Tax=Nonomuraea sp. B12E4 TaxID=3153564 RepID=UPI00325DB131
MTGERVELAPTDDLRSIRRWPIDWDLATLRARVRGLARAAGLTPAPRVEDLVIAVHEAAVNVLEHGGGRGTVCCWHDRDTITVQVTDTSGRLSPEQVPHRQPRPSVRGHGLWLIRQTCDELRIDSRPGFGLIRLRMRLRHGQR